MALGRKERRWICRIYPAGFSISRQRKSVPAAGRIRHLRIFCNLRGMDFEIRKILSNRKIPQSLQGLRYVRYMFLFFRLGDWPPDFTFSVAIFSPYGDNDSKCTFPLTEFVDEGIIIGNFEELSRERLVFGKAFRKFWQILPYHKFPGKKSYGLFGFIPPTNQINKKTHGLESFLPTREPFRLFTMYYTLWINLVVLHESFFDTPSATYQFLS